MTPATLKALAAEQREIADEHGIQGDSRVGMLAVADFLEQVAGADAGCPVVGYLLTDIESGASSLTHFNPSPVIEGFTVEPLIRQADHLAALTAQSGEGVALYELLKRFHAHHSKPAGMTSKIAADRVAFQDFMDQIHREEKALVEEARAAIAAYEAKRGGVR